MPVDIGLEYVFR